VTIIDTPRIDMRVSRRRQFASLAPDLPAGGAALDPASDESGRYDPRQ